MTAHLDKDCRARPKSSIVNVASGQLSKESRQGHTCADKSVTLRPVCRRLSGVDLELSQYCVLAECLLPAGTVRLLVHSREHVKWQPKLAVVVALCTSFVL